MAAPGRTILLMVEELYNDREFWYPYYRLLEEGYQVRVVGPVAGKVYKGGAGIVAKSDLAAKEVNPAEYDGLVNAGADYIDREVVVDGKIVTSRTPDDLPAFLKAIIAALA